MGMRSSAMIGYSFRSSLGKRPRLPLGASKRAACSTRTNNHRAGGFVGRRLVKAQAADKSAGSRKLTTVFYILNDQRALVKVRFSVFRSFRLVQARRHARRQRPQRGEALGPLIVEQFEIRLIGEPA